MLSTEPGAEGQLDYTQAYACEMAGWLQLPFVPRFSGAQASKVVHSV
jgi:hypothetical protein